MSAVRPEMRAEIINRIKALETEEDMTVLLAVESGSRAWGFWSEDSDYDVRFLYARPVDWHLSVRAGRDTVDRPISDELDLSGWDLRKTLGLMLGSNAVVLEWLQSPIRYREAAGFTDELMAFGRRTLRRRPVIWHYLRLATRQRDGLRDPEGRVKLKRYFYTMRPALALRWLRLRPGDAIPPMDMDRLLAESDPPPEARAEIDALIARKKTAGEIGTADETVPAIDRLIAEELSAAEAEVGTARPEARERLSAEADRLHIRWTRLAEEMRAP